MFAEDAGHGLGKGRLVAADAGEGFLALDALGNRGVGISHTDYFVHFWNRDAQGLDRLGHVEFVLYEFHCAERRLVDLEDDVRLFQADVSDTIAPFPELGPGRKVDLSVLFHNISESSAEFHPIFRFEFRDFGTDFVFYGLTDGLSVYNSHSIRFLRFARNDSRA